mmetsp:Transcript_131153/g.213487  ORF Transcript_131153/g.213487 Transcript_131153/m.213487 type:complete len:261 (-) Transcript_131153:418-1200(-)
MIGSVLHTCSHPRKRQAKSYATDDGRLGHKPSCTDHPSQDDACDVPSWNSTGTFGADAHPTGLAHLLQDPLAQCLVKITLAWRWKGLSAAKVITTLLHILNRKTWQLLKCLQGNVQTHVTGLKHHRCITASTKVNHVRTTWMIEIGDVVCLASNDDVPLLPSIDFSAVLLLILGNLFLKKEVHATDRALILFHTHIWDALWHPTHLVCEEVDHGSLVQDLYPGILLHGSGVEEHNEESVSKARVELRDLPHGDVPLERVL